MKKKVWPLIVLGLGILGLLGAGLFALWSLARPEGLAPFSEELERLDREAGALTAQEWGQRLIRLSERADTASAWFRLLKRSYALAGTHGDWTWLHDLAQAAQERFPGNESFSALGVHALLRSGQSQAAARWAESRLSIQGPWQDLAREARLAALLTPYGWRPDWRAWLQELEQNRDPDFFLEVADLTGEALVRRNALLLWLAQGQWSRAWELLEDLPVSAQNPLLLSWMYYDRALWRESLEALSPVLMASQDPQLLATAFDLYQILGRPSEALTLFERLQTLVSQTDADLRAVRKVTLNAAALILDQDSGLAQSYLDRLRVRDPGPWVDRLQEELWAQTGQSEALRAALCQSLTEPTQEARFHRYFPQPHSLSRLWVLFHQNRNLGPLTEILVRHLLREEDRDSVRRVLDLSADALARPWWWWTLLGTLEALEGRWSASLEAWDQVPPKWRDSRWYYHRALVLERSGEPAEAVGLFQEALALSPDRGENAYRSRVLTRLGLSLLALDRLPEARRAWQEALALVPDNWEAGLALKTYP